MRISTNRARGFAMIAALGVLAVVSIVVLSAASSTQFTHAFVGRDFRDSRLRQAIVTQARMLANSELDRGPSASDDEVKVTVTLYDKDLKDIGTDAVARRDGDVIATISAEFALRNEGTRTSVYLVNTKGQRKAPILLTESVSAGGAAAQ